VLPGLRALADGLHERLTSPGWHRSAAATEITAMLARLSADLAEGALGIGVLLGYPPATRPDEYLQVAGLAAEGTLKWIWI
jgi:hypothetical protein